jgi:hypothetical protein
LRNAIERIFGILKKRFPVLVASMQYPYQFQVSLVIALCVVHNFIRRHGGAEDYFNQMQVETESLNVVKNPSRLLHESNQAKEQRDKIASRMWSDYQECLGRR